jgi:two-component system cell cycle sensor histidine kinase/response regulator CckA
VLVQALQSPAGEAGELSAERLKRFFDQAPVGIAMTDANGVITDSNRAFAQLVGQSSADGLTLEEIVNEAERDKLRAKLAAVVGGSDGGGGFDVRLPGMATRIVSLSLNRADLRGDRPDGLIVTMLDVTEQRGMELQLTQAQKMQAVGQLAGGIAHDFNNLLTAMIGFCDLLLLRHRPGEQSFADVMQIKQNANRAASLVRQLLAFSRQQTLQPKVLNITDVLAEAGHLLRRLIGENIELKIVHGRDLGLVLADQGQLDQVVMNLAVNARDAMAGGGTLTVRTGNQHIDRRRSGVQEIMPPGDYVLIEVSDTGHGIDATIINRIFEPFFTTKEVGSGTGLGLSTVYGIVKQTGGFIFVDSAVGQGTTFSIYLPHYKGTETKAQRFGETAEPPPARDLTGAGTVLLVEDEDAVRLFGARALRNKGYKVLEARSGELALEALAKSTSRVDVLITDVVMPEMDGPTLIRRVRDQQPDIRVICISGYAEDSLRKRLTSTEDIRFLPKPFTLNQLAAVVKEAMTEA